jgi:hypothetical protein
VTVPPELHLAQARDLGSALRAALSAERADG